MNVVLKRLLHTTLLSDSLAAEIRSGIVNIAEIVDELLITAIDADAFVRNHAKSTWNEKRIARQVLVLAFLHALLAYTTPVQPHNA
jgi:hypothetical protein